MKQNNISIFLFTRDLRLYDNTTLIVALQESKQVIPIFIFNPDQVSNKNKYRSEKCIQFMCECLDDLSKQLKKYGSKLYTFYGDPIDILDKIIRSDENITGICVNKDYTPFAIKREDNIRKLCEKYEMDFVCYEDYLLTGIDKVVNTSGNGYVKFTPFYTKAKKSKVDKPIKNSYSNYYNKKIDIKTYDYNKLYKYDKNVIVSGGRTEGLKYLKQIDRNNRNYDDDRNYPGKNTTLLSAYLKFNVLSIRETYYHIKESSLPSKSKSTLLKQLYWRDFYMLIMYDHPYVLGNNMNNYKIKWKTSSSLFNKWCDGLTGVPIIDAGMRQLNTIGWMHNKCRMLVASFLVKILHIDWKQGEKYFAQNLVDYDPANNNGGWQWCASTGTDSQPYFRYFNPWSQAEKYDKECEYIKKWIPELKNVDNKDIHKWYEKYNEYDVEYPKPIVDNDNIAIKVKETIKMYKK